MTKNGEDYGLVLSDAQKLGLAEPDPTFDVEGMDAAYKLSIMASLAFHGRVTYGNVYREGITQVTADDIAAGKDMGYTLKLLAIAKKQGSTVEVRVHPTFVPNTHPLASVDGSVNAAYLYGHSCEDMMLQGFGAGTPTASAVVSDIMNAATGRAAFHPDFAVTAEADPALSFTDNWSTRYFIRINAVDAPGVLSKVADAFARHNVSIATMRQSGTCQQDRARLIFVTHIASEKSVQAALSEIGADVGVVENVIRVEE